MVHIISKSDEPRREDVQARRVISENRGKIEGIANLLTGGRLHELRKPFQRSEAETAAQHYAKLPRRSDVTEPYVRISPNRRVVIVDAASNLQLHFIGQVRASAGGDSLVLATRENGFFGPLEDDMRAMLADLDGFPLPDDDAEEELKRQIAIRLGFAPNSGTGG